MAIYAADGSTNVTVVDGSTRVGTYAADGSLNVVLAPDPVAAPVGNRHPSGAMYVTVATGTNPVSRLAADGSTYVVETPYTPTGALKVTAVSGDLTP